MLQPPNHLMQTVLAGTAMLWCLLLSPVPSKGQAANPTHSTYNPSSTSLTGTQSVTLLPGFYVAPGNYLQVYITGGQSNPPAGPTQNYIQKTSYLLPALSSISSPTATEAMRDITYFDGLGRLMQEVQARATPGMVKDIAVPVTYDGFGRQDKDYLPYATLNGSGGDYKEAAVAEQANYYNNSPGGITRIAVSAGLTPSFSQRKYEASPLGRITEQGSPGRGLATGF